MKKIILVIIILGYMFFIYRTEMYTIETSSMDPKFKENSVVLVDKKFDYNRLKVGDIIAYDNGYKIIIHRVMEIGNEEIITRGDANTTLDGSHATRANYKGKYICNFTIIGKLLIFLRSFYGFVTIVIVVTLFYLLKKPFRKLRRIIKNSF